VQDSSLPEQVLHFIRNYIDRLETLEVLALLIAAPARHWTIDELSRQMRSSDAASTMALDALVRAGLAEREGHTFFFQAASAELERGARNALDCYRDRRASVIGAIYQNQRGQ